MMHIIWVKPETLTPQIGCPQWGPVQPSLHRHSPLMHLPPFKHVFAQRDTSWCQGSKFGYLRSNTNFAALFLELTIIFRMNFQFRTLPGEIRFRYNFSSFFRLGSDTCWARRKFRRHIGWDGTKAHCTHYRLQSTRQVNFSYRILKLKRGENFFYVLVFLGAKKSFFETIIF